MKQGGRIRLKRGMALLLMLTILMSMITVGQTSTVSAAAVMTNTGYKEGSFGTLLEEATQFIVVKHKQLGGSHYAYTDGLSDETGSPMGNESVFRPGSEMVLVTLSTNSSGYVMRTEQELLTSPNGVIRDPDVSEDGTKVIFSWKKDNADDFHLYEMTIKDGKYTQLTFGSGVADVEPKYLANGKIVFNSTRCISNVDCWLIPVMNMYTCDADGSNIMRLGYDQVHTTYPTTTEDGRVLYTRWDYNDRNQMYIQSVFQMFPDGTNQTEVYGNNSNFPTTLLHTREVPGSSGLYVSISSGHHTWQAGKLVLVDTNVGRNDKDAVSYVFPDEYSNKNDSIDTQGQSGALYKYPVALNDHEFLVSYCASGWTGEATQFDIYYMNTETNEKIRICAAEGNYGASQVAMVKTKDLFERPSMVNRAVEYGTFYMANVYAGDGLEGVEFGAAKYLRVVEIEYRPYAIGATIGVGTGTSDPYTPVSTGNGSWDLKRVLGIVDIEEDGSALFRVPADTPVYFQVLNEDGEMIQSMRSWSTLMPNETFSCVGCHEDKNTVPLFDATTTLAMKRGVQELRPDLWMTEEDGTEYEEGEYDVEEDTKGFSYTEQVQPILDANCISCHNDANASYEMISGNSVSDDGLEVLDRWITTEKDGIAMVELGSDFKYTMTKQNGTAWRTNDYGSLSWETASAPFGCRNVDQHPLGTFLDVDGQNVDLYMRKDFTLSADDLANLDAYDVYLRIFYDENPAIYLNGTEIFSASGWLDDGYVDVNISNIFASAAVVGNNEVAAYCANAGGGMFMDFGIYLVPKEALITSGGIFKYTTTKQDNNSWIAEGFNDSSWNTGKAPFGDITIDGNAANTNLNVPNLYLRSSFTLSEAIFERIENGEYFVYMDISWDEDPVLYLNGTAIFTGTGYTQTYYTLDITDSFLHAAKVGKNTLAASLVNNSGGQFIDFEIYLVPDYTFIDMADNFQYTTTKQNNDNWLAADYNDSSWENGDAPFGSDTIDGNWPNTFLNEENLYLRSSFTLSQHLYDGIKNGKFDVYMYISWDEDPVIYLNGKSILTQSGWTTSYEIVNVTTAFASAMQVGDNTLAASLVNNGGGQYLDFMLYLAEGTSGGQAFSLEGTDVVGPRERIYYSLSYLVLTDSNFTNGEEYVGNSVNNFTNWISSMSQCEMLRPYQFGSTQSNIIRLLKEGHGGTSLTEKEIQTIAAWIDLAVPYRGAYDESTNWGTEDNREATEKQNKRDYYNALDVATKRISTKAVETDALPITVSYTTGSTEIASATDNGLVYLYPETKYTAGSKVTVTLPEGVKYFFLGLDSRVGEALIYCPTGTYTYTIPSNPDSVFPKTFSNAAHPTITARIATVEELTETRNLAVNPYDVSTNETTATAYPHAFASAQNNSAEYAARNAIDGSAVNEGSGTYPVQSWGVNSNADDLWYQIDFGREVCVDTVDITARFANNDTYFTEAVLEFSDGSTQTITLNRTADAQSFAVEGGTKMTSYVKIKGIQTANNRRLGISEVEVYGTVYPQDEVPLINFSLAEELTMEIGTEQAMPITYLPSDTTEADTIVWSSSDASVATVDGNGTITALKVGTTTVTATVGEITRTCDVTVYWDGILGDVNRDGVVDARDITYLRRYYVGWDITIDEVAADVNVDGVIDARDITILRRYYVGWDIELGQPDG